MKAKTSSHIGMVVGAISLLILFFVVMIKMLIDENFTLSIQQSFALILIGISPSIPFSPIYISTWVDKFIQYKNGGKYEIK